MPVSPTPSAPPCAMSVPSYQWQYFPDGDRLCLAGPLARAPRQRRHLTLSLVDCADTVRAAFLSCPDATAVDSRAFASALNLGKRQLLVIHTAADCGVLVDLSGQARRLKQVSRYASAIREGIDALPEAFVLYDNEDRLLIANPQYSALYPSIADIAKPGARFTDIVHTSVARGQMQFHDESAEDWIQRRLAFHRAGVGFFEQHLATGQWMRVSERRTASGGITSIRAEITPLKDREQALQRATAEAQQRSQSLTRFLAIFSHEIRNGLNGIVGLAQILALQTQGPTGHEDPQNPKDNNSPSRMLMDATQRLSTVLSDLLAYLKSEATDFTVTYSDIEPRCLIASVATVYRPLAQGRGLVLRTRVMSNVPAVVRADPARVEQVVTNLVDNAIKYSQRGSIVVTVSRRHNRLRYEVVDQGIGIAPERLPEVFDFFSHAAPDTPLSTGLGLAISKKLVVAMDGVIGVDSERGKGSRFWFELPLIPGIAPRSQTVPIEPGRAVRRLRVGVLDDDMLSRFVAVALLKQLGHTPRAFTSGEALLTHLSRHRLDAVLLDLMMPGENGRQVLARIRALGGHAAQRTAVLITSGNVLSDLLPDAEDGGIDAVLAKPLLLNALGFALQSAVARRQNGPQAPSPTGEANARLALNTLRHAIGSRRYAQSLSAARQLLATLRCAIAITDWDSLPHLVHRVAGHAATLGFPLLGEAARQLDQALCAADFRRTAAIVQSLHALDELARQAEVVLQAD